MGKSSSKHVHHQQIDWEARRRAEEAERAAAAAQAAAEEARRRAAEEAERTRQLEAKRQQEARERAAREKQEREEFERRQRAAQARRDKEASEAARRLEEQRAAAQRAEERRRAEAAESARRLEEERVRRLEEAAAAARRLQEEREAEQRRLQAELEAERRREQQQKVARWQALTREYPIPDFLKPYITEVLEDPAADKAQDRKINIAVMGKSGSGKSSLILKLLEFGGHGAADGAAAPRPCFEGDGTRRPTPYPWGQPGNGVFLWDIPGEGTELFPARTYLSTMGLKYFDSIMITTDGRWSESSGTILQAIKAAGLEYNVVRTKVDAAVEDLAFDEQLQQEAALERIRSTLAEQLLETDPEKLHLVTTRASCWIGLNGGVGFGKIDVLGRVLMEQVERRTGVVA